MQAQEQEQEQEQSPALLPQLRGCERLLVYSLNELADAGFAAQLNNYVYAAAVAAASGRKLVVTGRYKLGCADSKMVWHSRFESHADETLSCLLQPPSECAAPQNETAASVVSCMGDIPVDPATGYDGFPEGHACNFVGIVGAAHGPSFLSPLAHSFQTR